MVVERVVPAWPLDFHASHHLRHFPPENVEAASVFSHSRELFGQVPVVLNLGFNSRVLWQFRMESVGFSSSSVSFVSKGFGLFTAGFVAWDRLLWYSHSHEHNWLDILHPPPLNKGPSVGAQPNWTSLTHLNYNLELKMSV